MDRLPGAEVLFMQIHRKAEMYKYVVNIRNHVGGCGKEADDGNDAPFCTTCVQSLKISLKV